MRYYLLLFVCVVLWSCKNEMSVKPSFSLPSIGCPLVQEDVAVITSNTAADDDCSSKDEQIPLLPNAIGLFVDFN